MTTQAEKDWATFRRYKFKGTDITQDAAHIRLSQKNSASKKGLRILNIIAGLIYGIPVVVLFLNGVGTAFVGFVYMLVMLIPMMIFLWVGEAMLRRRTNVDIYAGHVSVDNGNEKFKIAVDQIRDIGIRPHGQFYALFIWDGPVPIISLSEHSQENLLAIRDGMVAAIGVMNPNWDDAK